MGLETVCKIYIVYGETPCDSVWECSPPMAAFINRESAEIFIKSIMEGVTDTGLGTWEKYTIACLYMRDIMIPPNVRDHRAGPSDQGKAEPSDVAGSGASPCWADVQSAGGML